jgi:hypothetical protein
VFCPECGEKTPMLHWRTCVNEHRLLVGGSEEREIYQLALALPGFALMEDSSPQSRAKM